MDQRDRSGWKPDPVEKGTFIFSPMGVDRDAWMAAGDMPADVRRLMSHGAEPTLGFDVPRREISQYALESAEGERECVWECDRALAVGHLEFVPESELDLVRTVHPWQVALKEGKARACQDYSGGLNLATVSVPFGLPTAWDVQRRMGPDTHFAKRDLRDGFWAVPIAYEHRNLFVLRHPSTGRLVRATSLPFGWADSPRLFCSVTEAIAGEFRRRASDMSLDCAIHCFVDDYLLQGVTEQATQAGIDLLDDVMAELGMMWAPHKERGPTRVIEFLGLLLVNIPGLQCIGLTEKRQLGLLERLAQWAARPRTDTTADPVELAQLMGHLVFASQVVPGGRTYMQGMLSQMAGLEVDWARGVVRPLRAPSGKWRRVQLTGSFWRDLEWWQDSLESRNCVMLDRPAQAAAAITGTDASDWGTGQVAFLAGGREEQQLVFTAAEQRRTINWRELLGILRIVEAYGQRLTGYVVLIEGDNTASLAAATKWSSKAPGMQELIRRLFDACERWDITCRFCHTPGVLLHRPDQISREDPVEEPRARLNARTYASVERRFGGFTEWVGAEREHASSVLPAPEGAGARVWMHPTYTTVGSALRRLAERSTEEGGDTMRAVVLVPDEPTAAWRPLLRHFKVEARLEEGGGHLEMCQLGQWRARDAPRPTLILSYPRAVGFGVKRVWLGGDQARVQMQGAVLYQPMGKRRRGKGRRGQLYVVLETFDSECEGTQWSTRGVPTVAVAELLVTEASKTTSVAGATAHRYELSWAKQGAARPGGSFCLDSSGSCVPWRVDVDSLWEVGHLVQSREQRRTPKHLDEDSEVGKLGRLQYKFNFVTAEADIAAATVGEDQLELPSPITSGDSDSSSPATCTSVGYVSTAMTTRQTQPTLAVASAPSADQVAEGGRWRQPRRSEPLRVRLNAPAALAAPPRVKKVPAVGERRSSRVSVPPQRLYFDAAECAPPVGEMPGLLMCTGEDDEDVDTGEEAGAALTGAESSAHQLAAARASAAAAVEARKRPPVPEAAPVAKVPAVPEGVPVNAQASGRASLLTCRSAATLCHGCRQPIGVGTTMIACGVRVIHNRLACRDTAAERHAHAVGVNAWLDFTPAARPASGPGAAAGHGVRLHAHGRGQVGDGVRLSTQRPPRPKPPVAAVVPPVAAAVPVRATEQARVQLGCMSVNGVATKRISSFGGVPVVETQARYPKGNDGGVLMTKSEQVLASKLSSARVDMALRCMAGQCECAGPKVACTGGCGADIHIKCLGVGKSFASLGQFRCARCRAFSMCVDGETPSSALVRSAVKSMLWEVSVGKHSTSKGYSEYQRLEREWVSSMGGGGVLLPRDSEESFVAFMQWLAQDSGRARSFSTIWRAASGVANRTREVVITKSPRVKRMYKEICEVLGDLSVPCTQVTRRLLSIMLGLGEYAFYATLLKQCLRSRGGDLILVRSRVLLVLEVLGGLRVGEGVGDVHGLLANNVKLLTSRCGEHEDLGITVEAEVLDSKTGPGRFVNFVGTSRVTQIPAEKYIRELWAAYGHEIVSDIQGGFKEERADYSVVKVTLLGLSANGVNHLRKCLEVEMETPTCYGIATHARVALKYLSDRDKAKDIPEVSRYINIAGGAHRGDEVQGALRWAAARGFGKYTAAVAGPFLRATESGSGRLTHFPMQVGSTYEHHCKALKAAYDVSAGMEMPDLEFDLAGQEAPIFANHSFRRGADRIARETMRRTGMAIMDIDITFGWNEAQRRKDMQLHYQGLDRRARVRLARTTMFV
jgi:hypothetical protein